MQTTVTPADVVGAGAKAPLSEGAQSIIDRLKEYYRANGKPSAAQNYCRHLRNLFAWCEGQGYSVHDLPPNALEDFLSSLSAAGQKETTVHIARTQIKTALREVHAGLGLDFARLEYQTGKPPAVRAQKTEQKRAKREAAREETDGVRQRAIEVASATYAALHTPQEYAPAYSDLEEEAPMEHPQEHPPEAPRNTPASGVAPAYPQNTPATPQTPTVVVMNAPAQPPAGRANVTQRTGTAPAVATPARGVLVSNHIFTGPYIRICRIADGSDPLSPPGTENIVQTVAASQVLAHGDIASFLQQWTLPSIVVKPGVTTLQLVFHELNEKRQPTGRRDELSFAVPPGGFGGNVVGGAAPAATGASSGGGAGSPSFDRATEYLLKKLDADADAARKRADDLQEQLREAKDAQTTFLLTQQMQAAQDLKRDLEERKERELLRAMQPQVAPVAVVPPAPSGALAGLGFLEPQAQKADASAEMAKAFAEGQARSSEAQSRMMEALLVKLATPPPPPPPQKDSTEFMLTFISQMNQQAQAAAAAQQQMMLTLMQSQQQQSQQFMQVLMTPRESPMEKLLWAQIQEVKAAAASPKEDDIDSLAEKIAKIQQVNQIVGGGSASNFFTDLIQNADAIGAGAAQVIAAAKGLKVEAPPTKAVQAEQRQLAEPPVVQPPALPPGPPEPPKPTPTMLEQHTALVAAVEAHNEQGMADSFVKLMVELSTVQEPFVSMARRILGMFAEAQEEADLYEVAKSLWIAVGKAPFRPHAKVAAKVFAKWYSPLHKAFFEVEKELPGEQQEQAQAQTGARVVVTANGHAAQAPVAAVATQQEADEAGDESDHDDEDEGDDQESAAGAVEGVA